MIDGALSELIRNAVREVLREELPRLLAGSGTPPNDAPLSPAAAAELAGCTAETVRRAVRAGALPFATRGRSILLERADVLRWSGRSAPAKVVDLADAARQAVARARGAR